MKFTSCDEFDKRCDGIDNIFAQGGDVPNSSNNRNCDNNDLSGDKAASAGAPIDDTPAVSCVRAGSGDIVCFVHSNRDSANCGHGKSAPNLKVRKRS